MILQLFAIWDSKVSAYDKPIAMKTKGEFLRAFSDLVNDAGTMFNKHSEDYFVYQLGSFDDSKGSFDLHEPISLGCASEFKSN